MKRISAPVLDEEPERGSLNKGFADYRTEALFFADETAQSDLSGQEFFECRFVNVTFEGDMNGCLFADCVFERCDFSNCDFHESVFRRCKIRLSRMTGTDFSEARFQDVTMEGCESSYAGYALSRWKNALWKDMSFNEAVFMTCAFENLEIVNCRLINADFNDTKLKGLDFSSSDISGIVLSVEKIKGAIMSSEQALACTRLLGIIVKE